MTIKATPAASIKKITEHEAGQRIDNFLIKVLKGVPKSRIYRAVRSGEVRINGSRIQVSRKIELGDQVRIPPIRHSNENRSDQYAAVVPPRLLEQIPVLYEDESLLVLDKPSGLAVHGGSGVDYGLIEALRILAPQREYIELVHRLDRETSGCLMLAKSRRALLGLQAQLSASSRVKKPSRQPSRPQKSSINKHYIALVIGEMRQAQEVELQIERKNANLNLRKMIISEQGQYAHSTITPLQIAAENFTENLGGYTLVDIALLTGKMHQARLHCHALGHPIAGDKIYGNEAINLLLKRCGLGRLFLHASGLEFTHPLTEQLVKVNSPLPLALIKVAQAIGFKPL